MNRREWLTKVFGAAAAMTLAPLVDLTDTSLAFWEQPPIKQALGDTWKIVFPDGKTASFTARVIAEQLLPNGNVTLKVQPISEVTITQGEPLIDVSEDMTVRKATPAKLCSELGAVVVEDGERYVKGLPSIQQMTFIGTWES